MDEKGLSDNAHNSSGASDAHKASAPDIKRASKMPLLCRGIGVELVAW